MSKLSVTQIETKDATTPLTLTTGNTSAGFIKVEAANSSVNINDKIKIDANNIARVNGRLILEDSTNSVDFNVLSTSTTIKFGPTGIQKLSFGNPTDDGFGNQTPDGASITYTSNTFVFFAKDSITHRTDSHIFKSYDSSLHYATFNNGLGIGLTKISPAYPLDVEGTTSTDSLQVIGTDVANNTTISGNVNCAGLIFANSFVGVGQGFANMNVISTVGTHIWNVPRGVRRWKVTAIGGGGSGGGTHGVSGATGNGGGSGGLIIEFFNYVDGVQTMAINVGRGAPITTTLNANGFSGNSTNINYNNTWSFANAGTGGANSWFGGNVGAVGIGGTALGGELNFVGDDGTTGGIAAATNPVHGEGGHTPLGYGEGGVLAIGTAGANGVNATGYGAGGGGGRAGSGTTNRRGGTGANGVVIIEW